MQFAETRRSWWVLLWDIDTPWLAKRVRARGIVTEWFVGPLIIRRVAKDGFEAPRRD